MNGLLKKFSRAFGGCEVNRYSAIVESDCVPIFDNVPEIYSYAMGKTKIGWTLFQYEYVEIQKTDASRYKDQMHKPNFEDKVYTLETGFGDDTKPTEYRRYVSYRSNEAYATLEDAAKRLKEIEDKHGKPQKFKILNPRVEPDRHYSKFETAADVPKRTKKIRHWKP